MKASLYLEGTNKGAEFFQDYEGQKILIESIYKDIQINSSPLAKITTTDKKIHTVQLIDTRFIDDFIFVHCFVTDKDGNGGKALLRVKAIK